MKRTHRRAAALALCLALLLCLWGCGTQKSTPDTSLQYPSLTWGMTPGEAIAALKLAEGDYILTTEGSTTELTLSTGTCFGGKVLTVILRFDAPRPDTVCLTGATVYFTEDTDMNAVLEKMVASYGEPANRDYPTSKGTTSEGHIVQWVTRETLADAMSEEGIQAYQELLKDSFMDNSLNAPLTEIRWSDNYQWLHGEANQPNTNYPASKTVVFQSGYAFVAYYNG